MDHDKLIVASAIIAQLVRDKPWETAESLAKQAWVFAEALVAEGKARAKPAPKK